MIHLYVSSIRSALPSSLRVRHDKFCNEVYWCLCFYSCPRLVLDVELIELDGPLYHLSCDFNFIHCFLDGLVHHYYDQVRLKIQTKLSKGHHQGEPNLLHSQVPGLSSLESLANVVH